MNKVGLITGASSGIGKELARIHAAKGRDLVIVARRIDKLNELKEELENKYNVNVVPIVKDLTEAGAPKEIYDEVIDMGIEIKYLFNNAGFGGSGKFHEREWEKDLAMINLNIIALTSLTRLFLPDLVKRNSGRILNTSSIACLMPGPHLAVYYATKAYVTSFSNAIAEELHDTNITVTALLPGPTETEFGKMSNLNKSAVFKKSVTPDVVATAGYEGMEKGKLNVIAGVSKIQKMMMSLIPFMPKKIMLKKVREQQEVK